jgi:hypothetical protein
MNFWEILTLMLVGVPLVGVASIVPMLIWTHHRRKMEELRMQGRKIVAEDIRTEFATIRAEIRDLRDTAMQYDLSFDTALQQMERRMNKFERGSFIETESSTHHNISLGNRQ